jgi:glucan-binding YG repeat protein
MSQSRREFIRAAAATSGAACLSAAVPSLAFAHDLLDPNGPDGQDGQSDQDGQAPQATPEADPAQGITSAQGAAKSLPAEIPWPHNGDNNPPLTIFDVPESDPSYDEFQRMKEHFSQETPESVLAAEGSLVPYSSDTLAPIPRQDAVLRLAVLSDTHSGYGGRLAIDKLNNALTAYRDIAPDTDALFIIGDLVCLNTQEEITPILEDVIRPLSSLFPDRRPLHLLMGNHDFLGNWNVNAFETTYGRYLRNYRDPSYPVNSDAPLATDYGQTQNALLYLGGVPIIKLCPLNAANDSDYRHLYSFLAEKLALARAHNADLTKPIFVMAHHPMQGAWFDVSGNYGYYGVGSSQSMVELLAQYPETVFLTGHTHVPLQMPQSINQDLGFTIVNTATAGAHLWVRNDVIPHDIAISQGILVDVFSDGKVRVTRIEFGLRRYIGTAWEFYPPAAAGSSAPFLTAPKREAARGVSHAGFTDLQLYATAASFAASFKQGVRFADDENAFVYRYRLDIANQFTGIPLTSLYQFSDFFNRDMATVFELSPQYHLSSGTWKIDVTALNPYDDAVGTLSGVATFDYTPQGWVLFPEGRRYYPSPGEAATGWHLIDGFWYYFSTSDALLQYGWIHRDGAWYYLDPTQGRRVEGWQQENGRWYYLQPGTGRMLEGWQWTEGSWYYLQPGGGHMLAGWQWLGGRWYYLQPSDGHMLEGWLYAAGSWYYLKPVDGHMLEGWQWLDDHWYYLKPGHGRMLEGWQWLGGRWYYLQPGSGHMLEGWQLLGGRWYYLLPGGGHMLEGWLYEGGSWYYLQPGGGHMLEGWQRLGGRWYYLQTGGSGRMLTGTHTIGGVGYTFNANGAWVG